MAKLPSMFSYARAERLSNGQRVSAIVEWPCGLSGVAVIYPMGSSAEKSERVREFLKERLRAEE